MNRNYIADARKAAKITQSEMAEHLGMIQSTYSSKEQANRFTYLELSKIEKKIGADKLREAKLSEPSSIVNEDAPIYGEPDSNYRKLLTLVNELILLQKTGVIVQAEIYAAIKNKTFTAALSDIKLIYKEKTGKDLII